MTSQPSKINEFQSKINSSANYNLHSMSMIDIGSNLDETKIFFDSNSINYVERNRLRNNTKRKLQNIFEKINELKPKLQIDDTNQTSYLGKINETIFLFSELIQIESGGNEEVINEKSHLLMLLQEIYFDITKRFMRRLSRELNARIANVEKIVLINNVDALKKYFSNKIEAVNPLIKIRRSALLDDDSVCLDADGFLEESQC